MVYYVPDEIWEQDENGCKAYHAMVSEIRNEVCPVKNNYPLRSGGTVQRYITPAEQDNISEADFTHISFKDPAITIIVRKNTMYLIGWYGNNLSVERIGIDNSVERRIPDYVFRDKNGAPLPQIARTNLSVAHGALDAQLAPYVFQEHLRTMLSYRPNTGNDAKVITAQSYVALFLAETARFSAIENDLKRMYNPVAKVYHGKIGQLLVDNWKNGTKFLLRRCKPNNEDDKGWWKMSPAENVWYTNADQLYATPKGDTKPILVCKEVIALLSQSGERTAQEEDPPPSKPCPGSPG
jgi:hypothetical protein